jgi:hypothetical protein
MSERHVPPEHNPVARYCVVTDAGIPLSELRDDVRCEACGQMSALVDLDPDFGSAEDGRPDLRRLA